MTFFRKIWRLSKFLLWMWPFAIYSVFCGMGGRKGIKRVAYCTRSWGKFLVKNFGVQVQFICDHPIEEGMLIVSNHQSYVDVLLHASLFPIRFTPKKEIKYWPILGFYLGISRPLWVDRKNRQKSAAMVEEIHRTLADGVSLLIYPEALPAMANTVYCRSKLPVLKPLSAPTSKFSRSSRNICGSRTTGTPRGMAIKPCCRMHGNSSAASKYA